MQRSLDHAQEASEVEGMVVEEPADVTQQLLVLVEAHELDLRNRCPGTSVSRRLRTAQD